MASNTEEKSKWFYTEFKEDTQAVVLLAHGLNLKPSKMDQLASFFNSKKCDVLRISLGDNPDRWEEKFNNGYDEALEHAQILERPLYFVGYSLGALMGMHFLATHPHHQIKKLSLFAPASHTRLYTRIPSLLFYLFPKSALPSFNLPDYRSREVTTLLEYKKMHELQKEIKENDFYLPTLVIQNPKDELVDSSELTKFASSNSYWSTLEISNRESQLPKKYHHLMIDENSCGQPMWQKILKNLTAHFSL